jgi:hypothetical protein
MLQCYRKGRRLVQKKNKIKVETNNISDAISLTAEPPLLQSALTQIVSYTHEERKSYQKPGGGPWTSNLETARTSADHWVKPDVDSHSSIPSLIIFSASALRGNLVLITYKSLIWTALMSEARSGDI